MSAVLKKAVKLNHSLTHLVHMAIWFWQRNLNLHEKTLYSFLGVPENNSEHPAPLLLTWINFNSSMDK